jgi:hypothetical protein
MSTLFMTDAELFELTGYRRNAVAYLILRRASSQRA